MKHSSKMSISVWEPRHRCQEVYKDGKELYTFKESYRVTIGYHNNVLE